MSSEVTCEGDVIVLHRADERVKGRDPDKRGRAGGGCDTFSVLALLAVLVVSSADEELFLSKSGRAGRIGLRGASEGVNCVCWLSIGCAHEAWRSLWPFPEVSVSVCKYFTSATDVILRGGGRAGGKLLPICWPTSALPVSFIEGAVLAGQTSWMCIASASLPLAKPALKKFLFKKVFVFKLKKNY